MWMIIVLYWPARVPSEVQPPLLEAIRNLQSGRPVQGASKLNMNPDKPEQPATGLKRQVVYMPSCVTRMMGPSLSDTERASVHEKMLSIFDKAGYEVIYPEVTVIPQAAHHAHRAPHQQQAHWASVVGSAAVEYMVLRHIYKLPLWESCLMPGSVSREGAFQSHRIRCSVTLRRKP